MSKRNKHTKILGVVGKECSKCKEWKPLADFTKDTKRWDGLILYCRECNQKYYQINKDNIKQRIQKYREENPEKVKEIDRLSVERRKEYIKNQKRIYYQNNKEKILKYQREYKSNRRMNDPNFKLRNNIARRILWSLKYYGIKKKLKTINLLGCDVETFKCYIEKKFKQGMSWENYGYRGWQIDHIIPCSSFDLTKVEEQKKCFHYTNTQPLWWWENLSKGGKYEST